MLFMTHSQGTDLREWPLHMGHTHIRVWLRAWGAAVHAACPLAMGWWDGVKDKALWKAVVAQISMVVDEDLESAVRRWNLGKRKVEWVRMEEGTGFRVCRMSLG